MKLVTYLALIGVASGQTALETIMRSSSRTPCGFSSNKCSKLNEECAEWSHDNKES